MKLLSMDDERNFNDNFKFLLGTREHSYKTLECLNWNERKILATRKQREEGREGWTCGYSLYKIVTINDLSSGINP